jgi:hypothetical protein
MTLVLVYVHGWLVGWLVGWFLSTVNTEGFFNDRPLF